MRYGWLTPVRDVIWGAGMNTSPTPSRPSSSPSIRRSPARHRPVDPAEHLGLVYSIALPIFRSLDGAVELDELVGFGTEGLLQAADRFEPERGLRFSTYAYHRVRGAIWDGVRSLGRLPHKEFRRIRDSERRADRAAAAGEDVAPALAPVQVTAIGDADLVDEDAPAIDARCDSARLTMRLARALRRIPRPQRALLHQHYWDGDTLQDVAVRMGHTKSWASRLHARTLADLRSALTEAA